MDASEAKVFPYWRAVGSFLLDFVTSFLVLGYLFAFMIGQTTEAGFRLTGLPAFLVIVLVVAYFVVFNRFLGGTIWRRILGVPPVR
ncbi:hypothetical protein [Neoaquamicrobium sediminum]|uniref:RDD family protein n=1 Tax=Neoaquamicrobium sediminum TaxID=1849104 RepID=A0ABV3WUA9_9HYPH